VEIVLQKGENTVDSDAGKKLGPGTREPRVDGNRIRAEFLSSAIGRILDIGCGVIPFWNTDCLDRARVEKAVAIDPNKTMIEYLKKSDSFGIEYLAIGVGELGRIGGKFDRAFCHFSLEHFRDRECALKNIYDCLKEGGRLLVVEEISRSKPPGSPANKMAAEKGIERQRTIIWRQIFQKIPEITVEDAEKIMASYSENSAPFKSKGEIDKILESAGFKKISEKFNSSRNTWFLEWEK